MTILGVGLVALDVLSKCKKKKKNPYKPLHKDPNAFEIIKISKGSLRT